MLIRNDGKYVEVRSTALFPLEKCETCPYMEIIAKAELTDRGTYTGNVIKIYCKNQDICENAV